MEALKTNFQIRYYLRQFHPEPIGQKRYSQSIFDEVSDNMKIFWGIEGKKDYPSYRKLSKPYESKFIRTKLDIQQRFQSEML